MRESELAWLAFSIESARCQEGEGRCSPPRHHEFGQRRMTKLLESSPPEKKFCPEFSREKEKRRE